MEAEEELGLILEKDLPTETSREVEHMLLRSSQGSRQIFADINKFQSEKCPIQGEMGLNLCRYQCLSGSLERPLFLVKSPVRKQEIVSTF